jgi:hypothetical protein
MINPTVGLPAVIRPLVLNPLISYLAARFAQDAKVA